MVKPTAMGNGPAVYSARGRVRLQCPGPREKGNPPPGLLEGGGERYRKMTQSQTATRVGGFNPKGQRKRGPWGGKTRKFTAKKKRGGRTALLGYKTKKRKTSGKIKKKNPFPQKLQDASRFGKP